MFEILCMLMILFWTSWRSQWRYIFTWRSLIINWASSAMKARIVCLLSHLMWVTSLYFIWIILKNRFHHILMFVLMNMMNSSTSMKLIVTVLYLMTFQSIISSKKLKQESLKLWRMFRSFVHEVFKNFMNMIFELFVWSLKIIT